MEATDVDAFFLSFGKLQKLIDHPESGKNTVLYRAFPPFLDSATRDGLARMYGGTSIFYAYLAAKRFMNHDWNGWKSKERTPTSLYITFMTTGNCNIPIDLVVTGHSEDHVFVEIKQKGKTICRVFLKETVFVNSSIEFIQQSKKLIEYVPEPHKCNLPHLHLVSKMDIVAWQQHEDILKGPINLKAVEYGTTWDDLPHGIFWLRFPPERRDQCEDLDPEGFLMFISDYYIVQSVANHLRKHSRYFLTAASMNHTVELLQSKFNPFQWFLTHTTIESMFFNRATIRVVIYSETKQPIAIIRQEMYAANAKYTPKPIHTNIKPGTEQKQINKPSKL